MKTKLGSALGLCVAMLGLGMPAAAVTVNDPRGDFIPTYTGPLDADLDVTSFSVSYSTSLAAFLIQSTMAGTINPAASGFYAIGVNTGTGPSNFAAIGRPGVRFNQVISIQKAATGTVSGPSGGTLAPGSVTVTDNAFAAVIPLSFLPTTGFAPEQYGFNIWPRSSTTPGTAVISDFAPENATIAAVAAPVPEPAAWATMVLGFAACGAALRHRRTPRPATIG